MRKMRHSSQHVYENCEKLKLYNTFATENSIIDQFDQDKLLPLEIYMYILVLLISLHTIHLHSVHTLPLKR